MVNLARIDKNVYKSLGFKNKSIGQTMIKEVLQTKVTNFKTIPALLQHVKPGISNLVNLRFDITDKKMYKQIKGIKKISKKIDKLDINNKDVEKIFVKWKQEFIIDDNKIRFVTGKIKVKEIYYAREDKTYIYYQEYDGSNTYRGSKESVIEQFKKDFFDKHTFHEASPDKEHIVEEIIITSIVEKESTTIPKGDNAMKNATPLMYNCIAEYQEFLQNKGTCVVDNFIGMYGEELKLTRDKFIDMCKEYYNNKNQCWSVEVDVEVPGAGATTVIFVVLPVCTVSRVFSISDLYSFANIAGLLTPKTLFNLFDIFDQLLLIKNTSSGSENNFTISLILISSLVISFNFFINFLLNFYKRSTHHY
jgi:hypothetical protein